MLLMFVHLYKSPDFETPNNTSFLFEKKYPSNNIFDLVGSDVIIIGSDITLRAIRVKELFI